MRVAKEKDMIFMGLDYYPFGMEKPGRCFASGEYKYGFNDKLKDDELKGEGNSYDFGARIYDPRIAKFLSIDPQWRSFSGWSPYTFAINNPIRFIDINGEGPGDRVKAARNFVGKGIIYSQKKDENTGTELRTGNSANALKYLDCSEFVCRVLNADEITTTVESKTTESLAPFFADDKKFEHSDNKPKVGDVALWGQYENVKDKEGKDVIDVKTGKAKQVWKGHVGIVAETDEKGNIKLIHAAGAGKGVVENKYIIKPELYRPGTKFLGYYRPKEETSDGKKIDEVPKVETTTGTTEKKVP